MDNIIKKIKNSKKDELSNLIKIHLENGWDLISETRYDKKEDIYLQSVRLNLNKFNTHMTHRELKQSDRQWGFITKTSDLGVYGNIVNGLREGCWFYPDKIENDIIIYRIQE